MNNWDQLADDARVWLYGANRSLTELEESDILQLLDRFCEEWAAHGTKLNCGFQILHHQIIVLGVDEASAAASGCSIDSSVQVFRDINVQYNLDLFNRLRSYLITNGNLKALNTIDIKAAIMEGSLNSASLFVDMLTPNKSGVIKMLAKPMEETWLAKYL